MSDTLFEQLGELNIVDGNVLEHFKKWKRQMQVHLTASGAAKKDENRQQ